MISQYLLDFSSLWVQISSQWDLYFGHAGSCSYLFVASILSTGKAFLESSESAPVASQPATFMMWQCHVLLLLLLLWCWWPLPVFICWCLSPPLLLASAVRTLNGIMACVLKLWNYLVKGLDQSHVAWKKRENGPFLQSASLLSPALHLLCCALCLPGSYVRTTFSATAHSSLSNLGSWTHIPTLPAQSQGFCA